MRYQVLEALLMTWKIVSVEVSQAQQQIIAHRQRLSTEAKD